MTNDEPVIETGVDKLVGLIAARKKVSIADAAKTLSVTEPVIQEWADFLEEEGAISIDYSLTNTYLEERKLSEKEMSRKTKDFQNRKEAFVRKAENSMGLIEKEAQNIENLKHQFLNLKNELGNEFKYVESELSELYKLQEMKNQLDTEMQEQHRSFAKKLAELEKVLDMEKQQYKGVLEEITESRKELDTEVSSTDALRKKEESLLKELDCFFSRINELRSTIKKEDGKIGDIRTGIEKLEKISEGIRNDVNKNKADLDGLIKESRQKEERITQLQNDIVEKVGLRKKHIDCAVSDSSAAAKKFRQFFEKKDSMEKLLCQIETDIKELKEEMRELMIKSSSFSILSKNSDARQYIGHLEKKMKEAEEKRDAFREKIKKLISILSS